MSFAAGVRTSAERCLLLNNTGIFEKPAAIKLAPKNCNPFHCSKLSPCKTKTIIYSVDNVWAMPTATQRRERPAATAQAFCTQVRTKDTASNCKGERERERDRVTRRHYPTF